MGKAKRDTLGDRMKNSYETRARHYFPRRSYTLIRVDGCAFHNWTKGLKKPYDKDIMTCMDAAALALCQRASGARFAFVQSDEISVLLTDFETPETEAWFDGNQSKIESVSAAIAATAFNLAAAERIEGSAWLPNEPVDPWFKKRPDAIFDARAWTVPDYIEVENYFVWRQQDAARNSVTLLASAYASHRQLHAKNTEQRQEIIKTAGDNWSKHPARFRHGSIIRKSDEDLGTDDVSLFDEDIHRLGNWFVDPKTPTFTRDRKYLRTLIPRHWEGDEGTAK